MNRLPFSPDPSSLSSSLSPSAPFSSFFSSRWCPFSSLTSPPLLEDGGSRLIVRLGGLLVSHSSLVSVICCVVGLIALAVLPVLAKNTYISENALLPGSANPVLSYQDVTEANKLIMDIISTADDRVAAYMEIP